jgi:hypothetical protein
MYTKINEKKLEEVTAEDNVSCRFSYNSDEPCRVIRCRVPREQYGAGRVVPRQSSHVTDVFSARKLVVKPS